MNRAGAWISVAIIAATTAAPGAQAPTSRADLSFEVASIKRNTSGNPGMTANTPPGGRYIVVNSEARFLITFAYGVQTAELIGAPDWIASEHYDINATAGRDVTRDEIQSMLRSLLVERFRFASHFETRDRPTYSLVLARPDGKLGAGIHRSEIDCDAAIAPNRAAIQGRGSPPAFAANGAPPCGMSTAPGTLRAGGIDMDMFARSISGAAGRRVVNKTGLAGNYELTLRFSNPNATEPPEDQPTIFTAVQEQLGLKLEPGTTPVQVLVVDHIDHPTVN